MAIEPEPELFKMLNIYQFWGKVSYVLPLPQLI